MNASLRSIFLAAFLMTCVVFPAPQTQPAPPEKVAVVFGQNIHYLEAGQGPAAIFLHGLVFDQCGHVPQIEKPAEFNRAVLDFLSR